MDIFSLEQSRNWLDLYLIPWGTHILLALAVFVIGRWAVKIGARSLQAALRRAKVEDMLVSFLGSLFFWAAMAAVIIAALGQLGIDTTSLLALFGAAGLAVGLALKDSLANFSAGILLIIFRPFRIGDYIEAGGASGVVEDIRVFNTVLRTGDNRLIIIPNGQIFGGTIVNASAKETRRIDLVVGIGYEDDLHRARELLARLLAEDERILEEPAPTIRLAELADSSVNFDVRPWVKREDYAAVRSDLLERIKLTFDAEGISIPYPQQDVHLYQAG